MFQLLIVFGVVSEGPVEVICFLYLCACRLSLLTLSSHCVLRISVVVTSCNSLTSTVFRAILTIKTFLVENNFVVPCISLFLNVPVVCSLSRLCQCSCIKFYIGTPDSVSVFLVENNFVVFCISLFLTVPVVCSFSRLCQCFMHQVL